MSKITTALKADMRPRQQIAAKPRHAFLQSCLRTVSGFIVGIVFSGLPITNVGADECLVREGKRPILSKEDAFSYQGKLFLTPDNVARYIFLTNRREDGDRSAALYRGQRKKQSLPGDYWVTATIAADSLTDHPNALVRRFDAPLPSSVANVLHELWLVVCQQTRVEEHALPSAPTGIFVVRTSGGRRVTAITTSLSDGRSVCVALVNLGEMLINYARLPGSQRAEAARQIEEESQRLLKHVKQSR